MNQEKYTKKVAEAYHEIMYEPEKYLSKYVKAATKPQTQ
jgi:hypothetical protein